MIRYADIIILLSTLMSVFFFLCFPAAVQREVEGKEMHQIMSANGERVLFYGDVLICKRYHHSMCVRQCVWRL